MNYKKELEEQARLLSMSAEREARCVSDHASVSRVSEWLNSKPRKPAILAFTEGPDRTMAYWFEKVEHNKKHIS